MQVIKGDKLKNGDIFPRTDPSNNEINKNNNTDTTHNEIQLFHGTSMSQAKNEKQP
jgi:hypothetical protein